MQILRQPHETSHGGCTLICSHSCLCLAPVFSVVPQLFVSCQLACCGCPSSLTSLTLLCLACSILHLVACLRLSIPPCSLAPSTACVHMSPHRASIRGESSSRLFTKTGHTTCGVYGLPGAAETADLVFTVSYR